MNGLVIAAGLGTQILSAAPVESKTAIWTNVALAAINAGLRVTTNGAITFAAA